MMTELLEVLKPVIGVALVFGILIATSFLAVFVFVIVFVIKQIKGDEK